MSTDSLPIHVRTCYSDWQQVNLSSASHPASVCQNVLWFFLLELAPKTYNMFIKSKTNAIYMHSRKTVNSQTVI